jgi:hypothetical protein
MIYPKEYIQYLHCFHIERDYFECHEIGEEYWKEKASSEEKNTWLLFIQLAVGLYHWRRKNFNGAMKLLSHANELLLPGRANFAHFGLNSSLLKIQIEILIQRIYEKKDYVSINFPLEKELKEICLLTLPEGKIWGEKSDLNNEYLINKHKLRDRSDVIKKREENKNKKKG